MENTISKLTLVSVILKEAWIKYKRRFKDLVWIVLPSALFSVVGDYLIRLGGVAVTVGWIVTVLGIVAAILSTIALVYAVRNDKQFDESYDYAFKNLFHYLWIVFLVSIISLGGMFLGIIPAFIFSIWFGLVCYIFVSEGDRGLGALLKSKEYVRGYFWPIVLRLIVIMFISLAVSVMAGILGAIIGSYIGFAITGIVSQLIIAPFLTVYLYSIYQDLARVKPELQGKKIDKNRKFFALVGIFGVVITLIIVTLLCVKYGVYGFINLLNYYFLNK